MITFVHGNVIVNIKQEVDLNGCCGDCCPCNSCENVIPAPTTKPITATAPTTKLITAPAPTTKTITTAAPTTKIITPAPTTKIITTPAPTTEIIITTTPLISCPGHYHYVTGVNLCLLPLGYFPAPNNDAGGSWEYAFDQCYNHNGGSLAEFDFANVTDLNFVVDYLRTLPGITLAWNFWVAATKIDGQFKWEEGDIVKPEVQPSTGDCLTLSTDGNYYAWKCDPAPTVLSFICQYP